MTPDSGPLRWGYLATVKWLRRILDGTQILESWTQRAMGCPRSVLGHLRTLLAVHNAGDLVRLDLPWWTYQAIDVVEEHLDAKHGRARVFEYGSGASTLWLARRAASVTSVEHHPEWAEQVRDMIEHAVNLRCVPHLRVPSVPEVSHPRIASHAPSGGRLDFEEYVRSIEQNGGNYDLVLIDGRARESCLRLALEHVDDDALILFDDAQRRRYRPALRRAEDRGWNVQLTKGATPCQPLPRQTALISREPISSRAK